MWRLTSNDVRVHWSKVVRYARDRGGVVIARQYKTDVVAVVPIEWYRRAAQEIGEPTIPDDPEPPVTYDEPATA
ncbi:hypothetical protein [Streptomyces sp. gCLA4]|uniref:hypothetical protein n=1 Tax=Streptomyces sp. gCLA4 TaxID=1873416 RepID=UPI001601225E|nr:hypothetical protein [Streptomyces sp. gCLA4]